MQTQCSVGEKNYVSEVNAIMTLFHNICILYSSRDKAVLSSLARPGACKLNGTSTENISNKLNQAQTFRIL